VTDRRRRRRGRRALALIAALALAASRAPAQVAPAPAERPRVLAVSVEGEQRYTEAQLAEALGVRIGEPLDPARVDAGLKRLWASFHVLGEIDYREVEGGIELALRVEEMPVDRDPRFTGNVDVSDEDLRKWALLDLKSELYVHQAGRVRQRLIEGYRREGYYFAEVNVVTREPGDTGALPDVIFEIREGPKVRVREVVIEGNRSLPDRRFLYFFREGLSHLAKREVSGPSLFSWWGSPLVIETLEADLVAMRNVYRDRGWLDAVVELAPLEFNAARDRVTLRVVIDEGERYRVSSLDVAGVQWVDPDNPNDKRLEAAELALPKDELLAACRVAPGDFYEKSAIARDAAELRELYGSHGYVSHESLARRVSWSFEPPELVFDVEQHTVAVTYRVAQGRALRIREILFSGAQHTRDRVLRREVSVFPGGKADLKEIDRSLARITATRFFSDDFNRLEHREPDYRFHSVEGDPGAVDLEFLVDEGRVVDFNIAGGVDSNDGAFGLVSLTMRNFDLSDLPRTPWSTFSEVYHKEAFHGAGQLLEIELSPGTQVSRFQIHFVEPDVFRTHLRPISFDVDLQRRLRRYDSHDEDRFDKRVRFGKRLNFDVFAALGFVHAGVDVTDLDPDGVPIALDFQSRQGRTTLAGPTLELSTRSLDNVLVPHEGYSLRVSNTLYSRDTGSDYDILQTDLKSDLYFATGETEDGTRPVLHFELDLGVAAPYGDTGVVPYSDRYFLGGSRSLRGFDYRGVGPVDSLSGFALGGETSLSGTAEWLYPIHATTQPGTGRKIEALRGGFFVDFGLLDVDPWTLELSDTRVSVGFGIGLTYPIPLSMNFGFPVRDQSGDDRQVFSFSLGFQ
jgi:outer membrane protein insertion porin family